MSERDVFSWMLDHAESTTKAAEPEMNATKTKPTTEKNAYFFEH